MPRFYVLSGADLGHNTELESGQTIGRNESCDLVIHDNSISRLHARVEVRGARWFLVDAGSRNGMSVGGIRQAELELVDGMELKLGEIDLRVRLAKPAAAARPAPAIALADEIQLEEEPEPAPSQPAPRQAPLPAPNRPAPAPSGARATPGVGGVQAKDRGILQYSKVENRGGILHSDLAQAPWYTRMGIIVAVLVACAALAYFAFRATSLVKSRTVQEPLEEESGDTGR